MNLSAPFIERPVATFLLSVALFLVGAVSFVLLPVSPLPRMDFPVISVQATLAGASSEVMAATVATPLERALGSIAGVDQMTSRSSQGSTRITLQFTLDRDINGAARDVQAAINAARNLLPSGMRSMPTYKKVNPAQAPIMILALTSERLTSGQLYDVASTVVAQKIAQLSGVGEVQVGGSSLPAVRIEMQPKQLEHYGLSLDEVRQAVAAANVRQPKGFLETPQQQWHIAANDQLHHAADYEPLIIRYQQGSTLRLADVARVKEDVEDRYNSGFFNGQPAVLLIVNRQADANILQTIERIRAELPSLSAVLPASVNLNVAMERTPVIRASLHEAEFTLLLSVGLVVVLVLVFLGNWRSALIPSLAVPVSLVGTFGVMYLSGFSLNTFSLMALILAAGLVVDDAIVVLENVARYIEEGLSPMQAAYRGSREVGFTLLSMSLSLVAVFLSILFMGGIVERIFHEFSITLSAAIGVSLFVSLTLTPMMCARWLSAHQIQTPSPLQHWSHSLHHGLVRVYDRSLSWVLRHQLLTLLVLLATIAVNVELYIKIPKTFLPQQDTGQIRGFIRGDDGLSFQVMQPKIEAYRKTLLADPAVENVTGFIGGQAGTNSASVFIRLKPLAERKVSAQQVVDRLRRMQQAIPGSRIFLMPDQDLQLGGGRQSSSQYSYRVMSDNLTALYQWLPKVIAALKALPELTSIDAKESVGAQQIRLVVDRDAAQRLGLDMETITTLLNNAFSQRQISTIYESLNQYKVVMEIDPQYAQYADTLGRTRIITSAGQIVPLSSFARYEYGFEQNQVNHDGQFAAENVDFDLAPGVSLDVAMVAVEHAIAALGLPNNVQGRLGGTGSAFMSAQQGQPLMILGALVVVYLVLGILYESYIHPLTILSTLPSAGVGALLAIQFTGGQFSLISLLGLFLLIGIVKKNAILMIDLALQIERRDGVSSLESIHRACLLRFRPILMTTLAALLGALPLLIGGTEGAEMRQPLGLAIIGGLILSQILTLYTPPVVYLYLDRLRIYCNRVWVRWRSPSSAKPRLEPQQ